MRRRSNLSLESVTMAPGPLNHTTATLGNQPERERSLARRSLDRSLGSNCAVRRWGAVTVALIAGAAAVVQASTPETVPLYIQAGPSTRPASSVATTNSGPRISFVEPIHDFGRVEYGKTLTNYFLFGNGGDQPLEILDIVSSCGCVAAQNWTRRVGPNEAGMVPVIFSASGIAGSVMKPVTVVCNDPTQSNVLLYVQATIYKAIDAFPPVAFFNFGPDSQTNETRVIRLLSNLEDPVTLSDPICTNRWFRAELKTVKPGKEFELHVTVVPPVPPGSWTAPVLVRSSSPIMPVVAATAYVMVQPALTINPTRVVLPPAPLTAPVKVTVRIQSRSTNAVALSEPRLDVPGAEVRLRESVPGRAFELTMTFPAGFRSEADHPVEATVKCTHPQTPLLKIRIVQPPREPDEPATGPRDRD